MTFNILYGTAPTPGGWPARRNLVADVIGRWEPDIAGLQEAMPDQLVDLANNLPEYSVVAGPLNGTNRLRALRGRVRPALRTARHVLLRRLEQRFKREHGNLSGALSAGSGADGPSQATRHLVRHTPPATAHPLLGTVQHTADPGEHCAILYRKDRYSLADTGAFWVSNRPDEPGSLLRGTWQPRVVHWARLEEAQSGSLVTVYNAHTDYLPWAPLRSGKILRERLDLDWDGTPQFLMGDLNTPTDSAAIRTLQRIDPRNPLAPPLRDAWTNAPRREGPMETLHRGTGRGSWPGRIDHILFRPSLQVERVSTVTDGSGSIYPSDHFPVVAELHR